MPRPALLDDPRFLAHVPWMKDDRVFPVALRVEDERPVIEWRKRSEFPRALIGSHFNKLMNKGLLDDFRCFLTGARVHWAAERLFDRPMLIPWAMTKEHLIPVRTSRLENVANLAVASNFANHKFGHMPLAVKLYCRDRLAAYTYDREGMESATTRVILAALIEIQGRFLLDGLYAYQPHTYPPGPAFEAATRFAEELRAYETALQTLSLTEFRAAVTRPLTLDIEAIFDRHCG